MKVVLSTLNSKFIHSSLALAYLEAACHSDDWETEVYEFTINESISNVMAQIYKRHPDVLCFSTYIWNIGNILMICNDYKKVSPECTIILGGPEVSYKADQVLLENPSVDFIVRGEGEITLAQLLVQLRYKRSLTNIEGISYRIDNQIKENPSREIISDLNILPSPYQRDFSHYKNRIVYYESSRGCPFNCSYCLSSIDKGVRFFSLERVKKELKHLLSFQLRELKFVDRTFNCNEKRAIEIMRFIIEQKSKTKVHLEICADIISESFLEFLKQVPPSIFNFEIGVQSTYLPALNAINRKSNWKQLQKNITILKSYNNIHLHLDLIAGLPEESYTRFQKSFNDVFQLRPDMLQLGFLKLLSGSQIHQDRFKHDYRCQSQPPYQILSNLYISYDELIKLNQVEELLNRYYNNKIVPTTLNYAINNYFGGNAFALFENFARYWEVNNLFVVGHRRDEEYEILLDFLNLYFKDNYQQNNELIKYDFLVNNLPHHFPEKIKLYNPDHARVLLKSCLDNEEVKQIIPESIRGSRREMLKYMHIEFFTINPISLVIMPSLIALLFVYDPTRKKAIAILPITQ